MVGTPSASRFLGRLAFACLVLPAAGCGFAYQLILEPGDPPLTVETLEAQDVYRISFPSHTTGSVQNLTQGGSGAAKAPATTDTVLSIQSKKSGDGTAFGVVRAPRELWSPFRWEVRAGSIAPDGASVGPGFFCAELDDLGTDPLTYYGICAQPVSGGLNVFVIRNGNNNVGQLFLPGTQVVDFAIEADGETLQFTAGAPGDGTPPVVALIAFPNQSRPLFPTLGCAQMPPGTRADFDLSRVVFNSLPLTASLGRTAREQVFVATDRLLEAQYAMDGGVEDRKEAQIQMEQALDAVDDAAVTVAALSNPALVKSAGKKVAGLRSAAAGALEVLNAGKPAKTVLSKVAKALKAGGSALISLASAAD